MKCYQPDEDFTNNIEDRNKEELREVVTLSLTRGAIFLVTIAGVSLMSSSILGLQEAG